MMQYSTSLISVSKTSMGLDESRTELIQTVTVMVHLTADSVNRSLSS